jgi:hypothetical protein
MKSSNHQRLDKVRDALLHLHKTLVDAERVNYEKTMGTIPSPNHFLKLLTSDPWFAWLHPMSQLIVAVDEALEEKAPLTTPIAEALIHQTKALLVASEEGEGFSRHYFDALQGEPDVVMAHAAVMQSLRPAKPTS